MNTVKILRQAGYMIRIGHYRFLDDAEKSDILVPIWEVRQKKWNNYLAACGGKTIVEVKTPEGKK